MTTDTLVQPTGTSIVSRALLLRCVSLFGSSVGFYLPLSVVPLFAEESGSGRVAGLATVVLLLATVAGEMLTPRLTARLGYRGSLTLGLSLLGAPMFVLIFSTNAAVLLGVCLVRGVGFAICLVAGSALTAVIVPADRRGEALAVVGLISGVSGLLALPAGVWAAGRWGYSPVFLATAVLTLLTLISVPGLPHRSAKECPADQRGVLAGVRRRALNRPAAIFASSTAALGVLVTFLPLATRSLPTWVAAAALLAPPSAATATRWVAGRLGDRRGAERLLAPGVALALAGMAAVALTAAPVAVIGGCLVFGAGFGILQNATLVLMYARVPAGGEITVSAIWNGAYDLGMAAGALGAGLVVTSIGYPMTFVLTAAAMLPALALTRRNP